MTALLLLVGIVCGLNFHLFFLQLYGWSGMVLEYQEQTRSWSDAAKQTLAREKPCEVCRTVEVALLAGDDSTPDGRSINLPFFSWLFLMLREKTPAVPLPPTPSQTLEFLEEFPITFTGSPDAPPPRSDVV